MKKIYVCLPFLKFSDPLPETHLFVYLALLHMLQIFKCTLDYTRLHMTSAVGETLNTNFRLHFTMYHGSKHYEP